MTPAHLVPMDPIAVASICREIGKLPISYTTQLELEAFRQTRAPHDGRRLVNALRYVDNIHPIAFELETMCRSAADAEDQNRSD